VPKLLAKSAKSKPSATPLQFKSPSHAEYPTLTIEKERKKPSPN
jgi:hypothetical protein